MQERKQRIKVMMKTYPLNHTHRLLEPGPVILVTTKNQKKLNIMTMGFHMMIQHEPPLIGCIIGPWDYTYNILKTTKECVLAIPTVDLAKVAVDIGNCSGEDVDKFSIFHLTPKPAKKVKAPLIAECLANIECRIFDMKLVNSYNLFILKAVQVWIDPKRKERRTFHHKGDGTFVVDGRTLNLKKRMVKWPEFL